MNTDDENQAVRSTVGRLPATIERTDLLALNEGLSFLFQELSQAKQQYESEPKGGREGVVHSVETVVKFLSLFEPVISSRLHAPLGVLLDSLMSLGDGKILPLLEPDKKSGRARASALRESLIGAAAFTVTRLMEIGIRAPDAHKAVANALKAEGVRPARGTGTMSARTIRTWCEQVAADVGRHGEAAQVYNDVLNDPKSDMTGKSAKQAQAILLGRLADAARAIRAHEGA